jgi:hypothetical protein
MSTTASNPAPPAKLYMGAQEYALEYLSGSLASALTYFLFSPLEVVKTRLQLQDAPGWKRIYNAGFLHALMNGMSDEGLLLFWSHGLTAGVCRDFLYSGMRTGMYPTVRDAIAQLRDKNSSSATPADASLMEKIAAGATTGSVGAGMANAIDVVRVRMLAEGGRLDPASGRLMTGLRAGEAPQWRSSLHCLADTARSEGVVQGLLLRGITASMTRAAMLSAAQMATYDHAKTIAKRNGAAEGTALHVSAALVSGFVAAAACNPADVLKSRVMSASAGGGASSTLDVAYRIVTHEGWRGFYHGFLPSYARIGPTILIQVRGKPGWTSARQLCPLSSCFYPLLLTEMSRCSPLHCHSFRWPRLCGARSASSRCDMLHVHAQHVHVHVRVQRTA